MKSLRNNVTASMQKGFTLIELVIVIVIIGILAAVAIPNFANLSDDAKKAKADATIGALASWASTNFARCQGKLSGAVAAAGCNTLGVTSSGLSGAIGGNEAACTIQVDGQTSSPVLVKTTTTC